MKRSDQILKEINDAKTENDRLALLKQYGATSPINMLLSLNFDDRIVVDLPEGMPPHKRDVSTHSDFQGNLVHHIRQMSYCFKNSQMKKFQKEGTFIRILESIPPEEADVLVHVKDKALEEMYPNITSELVEKVFPNYVKRIYGNLGEK